MGIKIYLCEFTKGRKKEYLEKFPNRVPPERWTLVDESGDIYFESDDKNKAMAELLRWLVAISYGEWQDAMTEKFGLEDTDVSEILLDWILTPDEKEAIRRLEIKGAHGEGE